MLMHSLVQKSWDNGIGQAEPKKNMTERRKAS